MTCPRLATRISILSLTPSLATQVSTFNDTLGSSRPSPHVQLPLTLLPNLTAQLKILHGDLQLLVSPTRQ